MQKTPSKEVGGFLPDESQDKALQAKVDRSAYVFNTVSGLLMAFQSVILLMVITRVGDLVMAGVFTIAYANANLFLNVGKYGMRNYQASDVAPRYRFSDYGASRAVTSLAMMACSLAYLVYCSIAAGYTLEKALIIAVMCLFKLVDAIEDVFHGDYQRRGRLDVGAKLLTLRMSFTIAVFIALLIVTCDLLVSLTVATAFTTMFFIVSVVLVRRRLAMPAKGIRSSASAVVALLKECFPLFIGSFLLFYIGNAPKYAIDLYMTDEAQALYGFISMPVFVVGLLSSFVYNPIIYRLACEWNAGNTLAFVREVLKQCAAVLVLTLACVLGALAFGVPVLNFLYNTDLTSYLADLLILVAGGGFYAYIGLFMTVVTIIRFQNSMIAGFVVIAAAAAMLSPWVVAAYGIRGASWEYFLLMGLLTLVFVALMAFGIVKRRR